MLQTMTRVRPVEMKEIKVRESPKAGRFYLYTRRCIKVLKHDDELNNHASVFLI